MTNEAEPTTGATGTYTDRGVPHGYAMLTPFIVVDGAAAAIDFYAEVFGASLLSRYDGPPRPDGSPSVMHAELAFRDCVLQLSDPNPDFNMVAGTPASEGFSQSIVVYVPDVDEVVARAAALGASVVEPPSNFVSGDRTCAIVDPFGRRWAVMTRVEDLAPAESIRRVRALFGME